MAAEKLCELLLDFKGKCRFLGWEVSEHEDWVHADNQYHNFLWTRTIYPSTFRKIAKASKCAIRSGASYQVINTDYDAWLFLESPPDEVIKAVVADQNLIRNTAIYDLSGLCAGKSACLKLNSTDSRVFKEFEDFLQKKYGVRFNWVQGMLTTRV